MQELACVDLGMSVSTFWWDLTPAELSLYARRTPEVRSGYWAGYFSRIEKFPRTLRRFLEELTGDVETSQMTAEEQREFYERAARLAPPRKING